MKSLVLAAALALAALGAACGDDSPTTPTAPASPTTSDFSSRLTVNGSAARSFATTTNGAVTVTLNKVNSAATGNPTGATVGLAIGIPFGGLSTCTLTSSVLTTAGSNPQFSMNVDQGTYCVAIYDPGTLSAPADFQITIVYP